VTVSPPQGDEVEVHVEPNRPVLTLHGQKIALGPLRRDLLPRYLSWLNDLEVTRTLSIAPPPRTEEAQLAWYEQASKSETDVSFTIYDLPELKAIGIATLVNVDHVTRTAEFGIFIGDKTYWGRGYGTETTRLVIDYGFTLLGLHNIMLRVYSHHESAIRAYTAAGFNIIGKRRQVRRVGRVMFDEVLMECLSSEFTDSIVEATAVRTGKSDAGG
jgi:RimJ/RimL family protein N-acetyltransferase